MRKLRYSPEARGDLDGIWAYIRAELHSPAAARNTVTGILNGLERLREFPDKGPLLSSVADVESGYRFLVCGSYIAFYRVEEACVSVDRVLYGRRDYLFDRLPEDEP